MLLVAISYNFMLVCPVVAVEILDRCHAAGSLLSDGVEARVADGRAQTALAPTGFCPVTSALLVVTRSY